MAVIVESFVSGYLLKKLVEFTEEKVVMTCGVKDELKKLEGRMKLIGPFLKDAQRRRITDESVKNWLNELKDVMYDADDMIDLWRNKNISLPIEESSSSSHSPKCCPLPCLSSFCSVSMRHEIAQQVKRLNARLEEIYKSISILNLLQIPSEFHKVNDVYASVSSPVIGVDVVGNEIKEDAKKLVKLATMDSEQNFCLVAITGMGGIGKTTLAQKIYNNQTIQNRYAIRMWLHISRSYSSSQIIKEAIRNAGGNPEQAERESELLPILANAISEKSFFLVLDDVWDPDLWVNVLQSPLEGHATHGFILVTTRDQTIAMQMGSKHIHQAKILSTKSGWELLCKRSYLMDTMDIQTLEGVGAEIVKKCGCLPLAIKAIAGMLATKSKTTIEWRSVLNNSTWSLIGLPEEINRALYLSYEDLSPQLKQCFLYCSLYPSHWRMYYRDIIVESWIAEGFIEEKEDQNIEDNAEECYYQLMRRHLLEPDLSFVDHSRCTMHDLLRSLAQYLSKGESLYRDEMLSKVDEISSIRRLVIRETNETIGIPGLAEEPLKLRTFKIFVCLSEIGSTLFRKLKYLRVLVINGTCLKNVPNSIGDLIHLRELDLDCTSISSIPESIGSLTNLLFLKLQGCEHLHTLPRGITQLCNLRHLKLKDTNLTSVPRGIGKLQKITEIIGFQVVGDNDHDENGWDLQELDGLSQLRRIRISKLERARNFSTVLANKTHLKELILDFSKVLESENSKEIVENLLPPSCLEELRIVNYGGKMLPNWMSSSFLGNLHNLKFIRFVGWSCCTELPPLGLLPNLKYLKIKGASSIVKISSNFLGINVHNGHNSPIVFPKLEHLIFTNMCNWEEWVLSGFEVEESQSRRLMPKIKELAIENCSKLRALPGGLQQLTKVERLLLRKTDSLKSIQGLTFQCESLDVDYNEGLETLSNLPGVKRLNVRQAPNLRQVSKLDSVEYVTLLDYEIEDLPEWLVNLMDERKGRFHFDLFCKTTLFKSCAKEGPKWPIIKCFSSVNIYNKEGSESLQYTREPESYVAS